MGPSRNPTLSVGVPCGLRALAHKTHPPSAPGSLKPPQRFRCTMRINGALSPTACFATLAPQSWAPRLVAAWRIFRLSPPLMAAIAAMRGGCRLFIRHAAAAFGRHQPCWAKPNVAHGHLCPSLLGLVAPRTQGSNCALTPFGESGIAYGFCSFVGWRSVVGKHISPTPLCCSVGFEVAAATSSLRGVFICLGLPPAYITLVAAFFDPYGVVAQFAPSLWGPRPNAPSSGGPRPSSSRPLHKVAPPPRWSGARDIGVPPFGTGLFCRLARWGFYAGWARCARVGSGLRLALVVCRALVSRDTLPSPA